MASYQHWRLNHDLPKYQQIAQLIENDIRNNLLVNGDKLPSQRTLAKWLNIDFTTVTRAYRLAQQRGWIENQRGSGAYVCATVSQKAGINLIEHLDYNTPPFPAAFNLQRALNNSLKQLFHQQSSHTLGYYDSAFLNQQNTEAAITWLKPIYEAIDQHTILTSIGAQQALYAILTQHTQPDDYIITTQHTYPGLINICKQLKLNLLTIDSDTEGPLPAKLRQLYLKHQPRFLYLNPTLHNPTTQTISAKRRSELAQVIRQFAIPTIEDDPYALLATHAPPPLIHYTQGKHIFYIATLSKAVTVLLRTAFIVLPRHESHTGLSDSMCNLLTVEPTLLTGIASHWIQQGIAQQFNQAIRQEAQLRLALAHDILQHCPGQLSNNQEGLHLWLTLTKDFDVPQLLARLALEHIAVADEYAFLSQPTNQNHAIRLSLGYLANRDKLAMILQRFTTILNQTHQSRTRVIV